jgi:hypothetical protein
MLRRRKTLGIAPREAPQRRVRALLGGFGKTTTFVLELYCLILYKLEIVHEHNYKGQN